MEFDLSVCAPTDFGGARNQNDLNILPATDFIGKLRKLTACESGVWSFVHLFQVRQCIRSEFISVVLSSSAECVDISNNFLSGLRHPLGVQLAGQPVGVQCPVNYFIHKKLRKILALRLLQCTIPVVWGQAIFSRIRERGRFSERARLCRRGDGWRSRPVLQFQN
jgi:hypothetical protein